MRGSTLQHCACFKILAQENKRRPEDFQVAFANIVIIQFPGHPEMKGKQDEEGGKKSPIDERKKKKKIENRKIYEEIDAIKEIFMLK